MAAPSRPYEIPPVLVHRDVPRMAATSIVVEGQDGRIEDTDSRRGATRLQQSDADMNGLWERSPPTNQPTGMEEESTLRSEQSSPSAIPTPANTRETAFHDLSAPSLSMDANSTILPELVESTTRPSLAVQVDVSTMNGTSTIRTASTTVPAFLADSGVKINEEALPGMNQGDPSLVTVPGMNQGKSRVYKIYVRRTLTILVSVEAPLLVTAPIETPLATPESSLVTSSTSAMTVDKPMPGKNQPKPTVDAAAASLTTLSDSRSTNVPTSSTPSPTTSTSISTIADVSTISFSVLPTLATSTLSSTESSTTTSSPVLSPVLTFVTITRTAQGKEDAQTSTQTVPAPLAVTAPQSLSSSFLMSSLVVGSAIPSSLATAVSVEPQSGLTPLARSLFILFGVLGK